MAQMSRSSPADQDRRRRRDPEAAREAILDAALAEFGAHGFAGARTAAIAERAGVSSQLLTHHFGGKQGILDELRRRWRGQQPTDAVVRPFRESVGHHVEQVLADPDWSRLVLWHALEQAPGSSDRDDFAGRMTGLAEAVRARQAAGEVDARVDPRFVVLVGYLLAFGPLALPDHLRGLLGGIDRQEYAAWSSEQLAVLLGADGAS